MIETCSRDFVYGGGHVKLVPNVDPSIELAEECVFIASAMFDSLLSYGFDLYHMPLSGSVVCVYARKDGTKKDVGVPHPLDERFHLLSIWKHRQAKLVCGLLDEAGIEHAGP